MGRVGVGLREMAYDVTSLTSFCSYLKIKVFLLYLQLVLVEWDDKKTREHAFYFLFENFKRFYLPHIFEDFNPSRALYDSSPGKCAIYQLNNNNFNNNARNNSYLQKIVLLTILVRNDKSWPASLTTCALIHKRPF